MAKKRGNGDPGQGSYPGGVSQPPGTGEAFPGGSWSPNPAVKPGGMRPPAQRGVADYGTYATSNTGQSMGTEAPPNASPWNQPSAPVSGEGKATGAGTAAYRSNMPNPESAGSRLTVSPSMKLVDPTGFSVPTLANGRMVPNGPAGRSAANFWQGFMSDTTAQFAPPAPGFANPPPAVRGDAPGPLAHPVGDAYGGGNEQRTR